MLVWMPVLEPAEVVLDCHDSAGCCAAVLFAAQSAANHLHVPHRAKHLSSDKYHVCLWSVEPGGKDGVVAEHLDMAAMETVEEIAARHSWCDATDGCRRDTSQIQACRNLLCVLN